MGHRHPRPTPVPPANRPNSQPQWPLVDWASLWFDPSCAHSEPHGLRKPHGCIGTGACTLTVRSEAMLPSSPWLVKDPRPETCLRPRYGCRSPRKLPRVVVARLLGRKT